METDVYYYIDEVDQHVLLLRKAVLEFDQDNLHFLHRQDDGWNMTISTYEFNRRFALNPLQAVIKYQKYLDSEKAELIKKDAILDIRAEQLKELTLSAIDMLNEEVDNV